MIPAWVEEIANNLYFYGMGLATGWFAVQSWWEYRNSGLYRRVRELREAALLGEIAHAKADLAESILALDTRIDRLKEATKWH